MIYYFVWILLSVGAMMDLSYRRWYDKRLLNLFLCILLILFTGLRYDCDRDFSAYVSHWNNLPYFSEGSFGYIYEKFSIVNLEFGYKLVATILKNLGFPAQSMFLFCSTITFSIFYKITPYYSRYPNISLFIFFSQFIMLPFMQIRFGVCSMLIWYSLYNWSISRRNKAILYFICAIAFHNLAFGVLLLLPLLKINIKYLLWLLVIVLFIPLRVVSDFAFGVVSLMGWNYMGYFDSNQSLSYISYVLNFILVLPIILLYFRNPNSFSITYIRLIKYFILYLIGFSLSLNLPIIARIAMTYSIAICFLLPSYISLQKKNESVRIMILFGIIVYGFMKYLPALKYFEPYKLNLEIL